MGGNSGGGGSSQTVQTSEPWAGVKPALESLYHQANVANGKVDLTPWSGPMSAAPTANTQAGLQGVLNQTGAVQSVGNSAGTLANKVNNGDFLYAQSNPYLNSAIDAAVRPVTQNFREQVLPGVTSSAIRNGAYGGARNGIVLGQAARDYGQNISDTASKMAYQNYGDALKTTLATSPQLTNSAQTALVKAPQLQTAVGDAQQGQTQQLIDDANLLKKLNQEIPFVGLNQWSAILGNGGGYSSTTSTANQPKKSTASSVLGGALGGASAGASFGPWGAGAGALLGGLGGLF